MMHNPEPLTEIEAQAVDFMAMRLRRDHVVPSYDEISREVGIGSRGYRIDSLLESLEEKGYIRRHPGQARALRVFFTSDGEPFHLGQTFQVPLCGVIAAGFPIDPKDGLNDTIELTRDLVGDPTNTFALRVQGNSMIGDSVHDGDLVILRHQVSALNGDMVAVWLRDPGETTLKRYYREGRRIRLKPANPRYPDRVEDEDNVLVQGKVVAVIRQVA